MTYLPKVLVIIPARKGSKGVPGKNLKLLGDKPLIAYTIESAQQATLADTILVSTDCPEVQGYAQTFANVQCPFLRPGALAEDESPMIDVVTHALGHYEDLQQCFDHVVLMQPTSPFRAPQLVDQAIMQLVNEQADSLVTVCKIPDRFNPFWAFLKNGNGFEQVLDGPLPTRRQELPVTYHRDGQIYVTRTSLIRQGMIVGGQISALVNDGKYAVNIDTTADWLLAEQTLSEWNNQKNAMYLC